MTIDQDLLEAAGIISFERVKVYNINNGERFDTYAIEGKRGSGIIGLNGAAARKGHVGDLIIIVSYAQYEAIKPVDFFRRLFSAMRKTGFGS